MRTISDVLQNKGGLTEYTTKRNQVLKIEYLTLKNMSLYETRLQNRAIKQLVDQRSVIPEDMYKELFKDLLKNIQQGQYAFGSEICNQSLNTIQGVSDLFSVLSGITPDEAMQVITEEGETIKLLFDEIVSKSIGSPDDAPSEEKKT